MCLNTDTAVTMALPVRSNVEKTSDKHKLFRTIFMVTNTSDCLNRLVIHSDSPIREH